MTGFEYTAAIGMLHEGQIDDGLDCIRNIRARYDGRKRSPFDEAECGHHYARAMIAWAARPGLDRVPLLGRREIDDLRAPRWHIFWSNGYAWGRGLTGDAAATGFQATAGGPAWGREP